MRLDICFDGRGFQIPRSGHELFGELARRGIRDIQKLLEIRVLCVARSRAIPYQYVLTGEVPLYVGHGGLDLLETFLRSVLTQLAQAPRERFVIGLNISHRVVALSTEGYSVTAPYQLRTAMPPGVPSLHFLAAFVFARHADSHDKITLDRCQWLCLNVVMGSKSYTTTEAAEAVGVTRATIQAWVKRGIVKPPTIHTRQGMSPVRLWTFLDISRLRAVKKQMEKRIGRPKKRA
jgi:hypothetical protein